MSVQLTPIQQDQVAAWIREGLTLSAIQGRLQNDLGIPLTYLEVRFLVDDLNLTVKDRPVAAPANLKPPSSAGQAAQASSTAPSGDDLVGGSAVHVEVDRVTRPGSMVSGQVTFSDGQKAHWFIDQFGRFGLNPEKKGYKPTDDDLLDFQTELQNLLQKQGL